MPETADKIVVDASVLGAIFFREPEAEALEKHVTGQAWVAPVLIDFEIGSIFLKKIKLYPRLRKELNECYRIFCQSSIERVNVPIESIVPLAEKHNLTIYDASYFWLAKEYHLKLLTLDKKLLSAWTKR